MATATATIIATAIIVTGIGTKKNFGAASQRAAIALRSNSGSLAMFAAIARTPWHKKKWPLVRCEILKVCLRPRA